MVIDEDHSDNRIRCDDLKSLIELILDLNLCKTGKDGEADQQQKLLRDKLSMLEGKVLELASAFEQQQQKLKDIIEQLCVREVEEAKRETACLTSNKALLVLARKFYQKLLELRSKALVEAESEYCGLQRWRARQPQACRVGSGGGGACTSQKLTTNDALAYVKAVKAKFRDEREKYDEFLNIMNDFKAKKIDTLGVVARAKDLFKGHPDLILGFSTFMPEGYEIPTTTEDEPPLKRAYEFEDFVTYLNKVQARFQNEDHVLESFLGLLFDILVKSKSIAEINNEVANLFHQHPDLLNEFKYFL